MGKRNIGGNRKSARMQNNNKKNFDKTKNFSSFNKNAKSADRPDRKTPGGEGFYRNKAKIKLLRMYREKPVANKKEQVRSSVPIKIDGNRKYFGNTRTIDDKNLEKLRKEYEEIKEHNKRSSIILKKHKVPVSLLSNKLKKTENVLLEPFDKTFGPKMNRVKPKLNVATLEELAEKAEEKLNDYDNEKDPEQQKIIDLELNEKKGVDEKYMKAGQSKRIYNELHKVMDSSDVICQVLDCRDPLGTRSTYVENFIKTNCPHKHIVIILNKCDLVPTWVTSKWINYFSKFFPTIAFHASIKNPYGKPALFQILRQYDELLKEKKHISVGFVGYPNVGKSSVINTLKKQACCKSAPIPGETRVWQYVTLTKRIYLIDCPGVVYDKGDSDTDKILKAVLRCEKIQDPIDHIEGILKIAKKEVLQTLYNVKNWNDHEDFVAQCCINYGKLLKGGDPDLKSMSKIILMDWQRGKIPYFKMPENLLGNNKEEDLKNEVDYNKLYNVNQDGEDYPETKNLDVQIEINNDVSEVNEKDILEK